MVIAICSKGADWANTDHLCSFKAISARGQGQGGGERGVWE